MPLPDSVLFLTLRVFSATGGIEKVCRAMGKALFEKNIPDFTTFMILSSHDETRQASPNPYFPAECFRGYSGSKWRFMLAAVRKGIGKSHVLLSHINLLPAGWLIRLLSPKTKLILLAHGIEVWEMPLGFRKFMLGKCDRFLCVSEFTKSQMISLHKIKPEKCTVLNNCLDPFIPLPKSGDHIRILREKYGIGEKDVVLFTLTRIKSTERYKGYDRVIEAMSEVKSAYPALKYLIAGKYDEDEAVRIRTLAKQKDLGDRVILSGYIDDEEIPAYFKAADIYIMPSYGEGFGITFIEAMHYGLPVIAGNKDGSVDALGGGELGLLVDPHDTSSVKEAILRILENRQDSMPQRDTLDTRFGYPAYRRRFFQAMNFN